MLIGYHCNVFPLLENWIISVEAVNCYMEMIRQIDLKNIVTPYITSIPGTVKPVYNDHLLGYLSAFWSSSWWPRATYMSSRRQKLLTRVNWYLQSSLKHITEYLTGNKFYYRGGRYKQVSLYNVIVALCKPLRMPRFHIETKCRDFNMNPDSIATRYLQMNCEHFNTYLLPLGIIC